MEKRGEERKGKREEEGQDQGKGGQDGRIRVSVRLSRGEG